MILNPVSRIVDFRFTDELVCFSIVNGYGEPLRPVSGLDFVPVSPVVLRVLNVVVKYKQVNRPDEIEVPHPGNVVRLNNAYTHGQFSDVLPVSNQDNSELKLSYSSVLQRWESLCPSV